MEKNSNKTGTRICRYRMDAISASSPCVVTPPVERRTAASRSARSRADPQHPVLFPQRPAESTNIMALCANRPHISVQHMHGRPIPDLSRWD
ncbi:hypothetical protein MTO96_018105 [Rhipicephalus appendiculatus]